MVEHARAAPAGSKSEPVDEAARTFLTAIHTLRTYPHGNEICRQALDRAIPALLGVVPIEIEVGAQQLKWGEGHEIDHSTDRLGISAAMYRDGVRRVQLRAGLEPAEIEGLMLALAERVDPEDLSEDYVTRLWEANLPHVRVLAIDPYLDVDIPGDVLDGQEKPDLDPGDLQVDRYDDIPPPPEEAFQVGEEDAIRIAQEVARTSQAPPWPRFVEVTVTTIMTESGMRRIDELVVIIETCFQKLIEQCHLEGATRLLRELKESIPPEAIPALLPAVSRMASADRLRPLAKAVDTGEAPREEAQHLLILLQPAVIPALFDFLVEGTTLETRRLYTAVLIEIGAPALDAAIERFRGGDLETQLLLTSLLAELGGPEAARELVAGLHGADPTLRREIVRALGAVRNEEGAKALYQIALGDENDSCRILALRALRTCTAADAEERLIERIGESGIGDEERDLLFLALSNVCGDNVIPFLTKRLKPSWVPGRWNAAEARRAAAALARLGTSPALETLEQFGHSRRSALAEICTRALLEARRRSP